MIRQRIENEQKGKKVSNNADLEDNWDEYDSDWLFSLKNIKLLFALEVHILPAPQVRVHLLVESVLPFHRHFFFAHRHNPGQENAQELHYDAEDQGQRPLNALLVFHHDTPDWFDDEDGEAEHAHQHLHSQVDLHLVIQCADDAECHGYLH